MCQDKITVYSFKEWFQQSLHTNIFTYCSNAGDTFNWVFGLLNTHLSIFKFKFIRVRKANILEERTGIIARRLLFCSPEHWRSESFKSLFQYCRFFRTRTELENECGLGRTTFNEKLSSFEWDLADFCILLTRTYFKTGRNRSKERNECYNLYSTQKKKKKQ